MIHTRMGNQVVSSTQKKNAFGRVGLPNRMNFREGVRVIGRLEPSRKFIRFGTLNRPLGAKSGGGEVVGQNKSLILNVFPTEGTNAGTI